MTPTPVSVIPTMTGAVVAGHGFALGVDPVHAGVPLGTCLEGEKASGGQQEQSCQKPSFGFCFHGLFFLSEDRSKRIPKSRIS